MVDFGPHLGVYREPRVEFVAGFGKETEGELALEHEDAYSGGGGEGEEFECEGGGDLNQTISIWDTSLQYVCLEYYLVGSVAYADIEVG